MSNASYNSFPHPNTDRGWACPVCKTAADRPVILVPKEATDDPKIYRAEQVHEACWRIVLEMHAEEDRARSDQGGGNG